VGRAAEPAASVENDPQATSAGTTLVLNSGIFYPARHDPRHREAIHGAGGALLARACDCMAALQRRVPFLIAGKTTLLHACLIVALLAIAIGMHTLSFGGRSDLNGYGYDEGVYWQSLRAMSAGYHLYREIFSSQPPLFLLSVYPFYVLLGSTIVSAREGVAALSLFGLVGAYLTGRALSGRLGGVTALAILIVTPTYLRQSQILQAEVPATALLFVTIGFALLWREHPTGLRGTVLAAVCATALSLGIFIKLLDVTAVVPIGLLVLERIWRIRLEASPRDWWTDLVPIYAGTAAAVVTTLCVLAPFWGSLGALLQQAVMFHLAAKKIASASANIDTLWRFFATNSVLSCAAIVGIIVAILRHDWRVVPLAVWLLATLAVLAIHVPLFRHHELVLFPPLIAAIALGLSDLPTMAIRKPVSWRHGGALLMGLLTVAVVAVGIRDVFHARAVSSQAALPSIVAADLERATTPEQWIITDEQFTSALANRDTPPWLVDTSFKRVLSGYLTEGELLQAGTDPRVHAVLFATGRLIAPPVARFHDWVADHFKLLHRYGDGIELWSR
jgi:4-amino-4-deoxy-L-arabinose transferase-like glycosyltransferase